MYDKPKAPVQGISYTNPIILERYRLLRDHLSYNVKDEQFDMAYYKQVVVIANDGTRYLRGTSVSATKFCMACAIGHGYELIPDEYFNLDQDEDTYYGLVDYSSEIASILFCFIASSSWQDIDNSREGAIRRIDYLLKYNSIPHVMFHIEVSNGEIT